MKVLHVNFIDNQGGAARAAYRLHKSLINQSVDSWMLVLHKKSNDDSVIGKNNLWGKILHLLVARLESFLTSLKGGKSTSLYSPALLSSPDVLSVLSASDADVINLHWTAKSMVKIENLRCLSKPIVWTMHDIWPFTGGCHCDENCIGYQDACGNCPILLKRGNFDLSYRVLRRKIAAYARLNITAVAPSRWMAANANKSTVFRDRYVEVINNGLDLGLFKPIEKAQARSALNLPSHRLLIMFGAVRATQNRGKGFDLLLSCLDHISRNWRDKVELIVFGSDSSGKTEFGGIRTHLLGGISNDRRLAEAYSAADVVTVPSRQENLPNIVAESLACGTPVVAFNIGGIPEMIEHRVSGYLAEPFDVVDLARGIGYVLEQQESGDGMGVAARERALAKFSDRDMAGKYMSLYRSLIDEIRENS
jgi:glycosyltransferase involved in cell wall biosynthesis